MGRAHEAKLLFSLARTELPHDVSVGVRASAHLAARAALLLAPAIEALAVGVLHRPGARAGRDQVGEGGAVKAYPAVPLLLVRPGIRALGGQGLPGGGGERHVSTAVSKRMKRR